MKFVLEMECNNAAFENWPQAEVARILRQVGEVMTQHDVTLFTLRDFNGNVVGTAKFVE